MRTKCNGMNKDAMMKLITFYMSQIGNSTVL